VISQVELIRRQRKISLPKISLKIYFDKLKPISVSEIQLPISLVGIYIYDFDKLKPLSVSEIQLPNLSLVGIHI
jgi:hypothetical protein